MTRLHKICCATLAVAMCAAPARADEAVTLRYKMTKGDQVIYRTTSSVKQSVTIGNMNFDTVMANTSVDLRTFESVDDKGNLSVKTENKQLKVDAKMGPAGDYKYDSTSTEKETGSTLSEALNPIYDILNGASLTIVHTPRGEVTAVKGYAEMLADVLKNNPLGAQFAGGGSDKAATLSYAEFFVALSKDAVKPGDTWETKYEIELPKLGKAEGKRVYHYEGTDKVGDRTTAKISVTHDLSFDLEIKMGGATVSGKFTTDKSSGTIQFDPEQGQVVSIKSSYTLSGNLSVNANGNMMQFQTNQVQTVTLELLDKLPE